MAHKKRRQAGEAREIEITDAMIEAGVRAYREVDLRFADVEFRVLQVFKAMIEAGRSARSPREKPPRRGSGRLLRLHDEK